ncbi:hypothetical protein [uncultured Tateyamaria sp.]|uniref:hypothetical protein n=1 Tax=uncultured Tateyamaria sp. TaxID=455651 RepID=UPI00263964F1|nr:hypothetical protein [uncultured Tateyamaria sp.]
MGGERGEDLDTLRLHYIPNYSASELEDNGRLAVFGAVPEGQTIETFVSSRVSHLSATRLFMETVFSLEHSSEAGVSIPMARTDIMGKTNTAFGFTMTTQTEFTEWIEKEVFESRPETYSPQRQRQP